MLGDGGNSMERRDAGNPCCGMFNVKFFVPTELQLEAEAEFLVQEICDLDQAVEAGEGR